MAKRMLEFEISGMQCKRCVEVAQRAIDLVPGVVKATVDLETGLALITAQEYVNAEDIIQAVDQSGYSAREQT